MEELKINDYRKNEYMMIQDMNFEPFNMSLRYLRIDDVYLLKDITGVHIKIEPMIQVGLIEKIKTILENNTVKLELEDEEIITYDKNTISLDLKINLYVGVYMDGVKIKDRILDIIFNDIVVNIYDSKLTSTDIHNFYKFKDYKEFIPRKIYRKMNQYIKNNEKLNRWFLSYVDYVLIDNI